MCIRDRIYRLQRRCTASQVIWGVYTQLYNHVRCVPQPLSNVTSRRYLSCMLLCLQRDCSQACKCKQCLLIAWPEADNFEARLACLPSYLPKMRWRNESGREPGMFTQASRSAKVSKLGCCRAWVPRRHNSGAVFIEEG